MYGRVFLGDSREVLKSLEVNKRAALVVTSPPYFVGREYEQYIDSEKSFWEMISEVFYQVDNFVEPFGKIAVNFADRYSNSKDFGRPFETCYVGKYIEIFDSLGYDLWARIIWDKVRVMIDGARHVTSSGRFSGQMRVAPNWEYIFVWRKRSLGKPEEKQVDMTYEEWKDWADSIWIFSSVRKNEEVSGKKTAVFPEELPYRLIKMYTEPGDLVIDPFCGTGTTVRVGLNLTRTVIGIEKDPEIFNYSKSLMTGFDIISEDEYYYEIC